MSNPANQLPPEYDDFQPSDYDPAYTADISSKMRVPERLGAVNGHDEEHSRQDGSHTNLDHMAKNDMQRSAAMNVPDKIVVLGQEQHMGVKDLPNLHMDFVPNRTVDPYVGLSTPPRVLTLDERFPHVEDSEDENVQPHDTHKYEGYSEGVQNGYVTPVRGRQSESLQLEALRATPGDPLLIQDEDEDDVTVIRKRLDKLTLHVYRLEEENGRRTQREWVLYPLVMVYFAFKVVQWFGGGR